MTVPDTRSRIYVRPSARDLGDAPIDVDVMRQACASLKPVQLGVWTALVHHLWSYGELPLATRRLAEIGKVGPKTFGAMVPALAPLFDHDEFGRWRDIAMEEERNRRLQLEPGERISFEESGAAMPDAATDPLLSEKRRVAGQAGAKKRWADKRRQLQVLQGGKADADESTDGDDGKLPPFAMASLLSGDGKTDGSDDGKGVVGLPSSLPSDASRPPGPSVGLLSGEIQEKKEESDGRTDARAGDASAADPGKPGGKPDPAPDGKTAPVPDGKTGGADDGKPDAAEAVRQAVDDTGLIAALRKAGGAKIPPELLTRAAIAPVRDLMVLCDLEADILPVVGSLLPGLKSPLRSWLASFFVEAAIARRDQRIRDAGAPAPGLAGVPPPAPAYIFKDSPQWRAWRDVGRKMPTYYQRKGDRSHGWYVATEWPPGVDPAAYVETRPKETR